ncbi:tRNA 5-hydroxyuridine modification protein YegQ (plasmid) [Pseudoalteromonas espejiana]
MRYAFAYGADAVYAGQPRYSLRVRNNEFDLDTLQIGIKEAHAQNKKFYVVSNIAPHNAKVKSYLEDIAPVIAMQPDALIMSDPGLIMLVREKWPTMPIHLSVQANAVNYASVLFWAKQGIERVILSRELSLEEIKEIRTLSPNTELEVFVHGSFMYGVFWSLFIIGLYKQARPKPRTCTNACRWNYDVKPGRENETGEMVHKFDPKQVIPTLGEGTPTNNIYMLEEQGRPGEFMPAFEDEHGTYIMNSKDLRAVQYVEQLTNMGVHSLKIEGRTKSFYYVARTAQVYRKAIDDAAAGKPFDTNLFKTLENLAHRGYTEGFLKRHAHNEYQNYEYGHSVSTKQQFVGEVLGTDENGLVNIDVKNKFCTGHSLELMTPQGNMTFKLGYMQNNKGESITDAKGSGHIVKIRLDESINLEHAILMRNLNEHQDTRNPYQKAASE